MIEKQIEFKNNLGKKLVGIIHIPDDRGAYRVKSPKGPFPGIVLCSGFKRTKTQSIIITSARNFVTYGFVVLRFDFSGWGKSEGYYSESTVAQQINDVISALGYLKRQNYCVQKLM